MKETIDKVRKSYMITIENQFNISYMSSGLFTSNEDWIHPKRQINSHEFIYVTDGTVYIQENDVAYCLSKGDLLILYPDRIHFGYKTSQGRTSFYWAHFTTSDYQSLEIKEQYLPSVDKYKFVSLFKQLLHIANTSGYPRYSSDLILTLIVNEISITQKDSITKYSKLIKDVAEWIRINSDKLITVDAAAGYFGYNPDYLSGLFKKTFGIGLKQYINNEKIKLAKNLILMSDYSIKQISYLMGWEDENQFVKYFDYHESVSPMKYRNMYFNTHLNKK